MSVPASRPFAPKLLDDLVAFCAGNTGRRPETAYLRPGDVVWRLPLHRFATLGEVPWLRLWLDARGVAGYAWFEPPTGVELDLRADLPWRGETGNAMFDWAEAMRREAPPAYPWLVELESMEQWANAVREPVKSPHPGRWLATSANEGDADRLAALRRRGYQRTKHHAVLYARDLASPVPPANLPARYQIRHTTKADLAERVAVHRDAWVGSSWTAERYKALRAAHAYDATLDLVVEDETGHFAACCICWADPISRAGSFEPVGTRPAFRGRGITRQLIQEGFRRLAAKGMATAHTETPGFNTPAQALYESSGFERAGKRWTYMKEINVL